MRTSHYLMSALLGSVLVLLSVQNTYSQGFYFNAGGGYSFSASNITYVNLCPGFEEVYPNYEYPNITPFSFIGANQSYTTTEGNAGSNYTSTYQALNKGFGGGGNFFISAGYSFNQYISAELGFSYLAGTTLQSTYTEQDNYSFDNLGDNEIINETITNNLKSSPIYRILPAVKFSVPFSKFTPYLKAGLIVGLGEKVTISNAYSEVETESGNGAPPSSYSTGNMALTASGGLSLGYTGSVGVEYKISNLISVYGEFNIINESWSPTKGDITAFTESDATPPYVLTNSQFTYSDNVTTGGATNNINQGNNVIEVNSQYPKQTFSFNSYGFAIGVKFSLPTKNSAASNVSPPSKAN